jgi:hypothetical protein
MSVKSVRKFIRDCYDNKYGVTVWDVLDLNRADILGHKHPSLEGHEMLLNAINVEQGGAKQVQELESPLDGYEIMALHPMGMPGPYVGHIKRALTEKVIDGTLAPDDKEGAKMFALGEILSVEK